jgi:two-component system invasion response regulator UvrY
MTDIIITDDHKLFREGLRKILISEADFNVVAEASNSAEVLDLIRKQKVDIVTLDLSMPGVSGLETIKEIKKINKKLPVLIISMHPEERFALRCLKAGASGYISKEKSPDELVIAIRKILRGEKYISERLAEILSEGPNEGTDFRHIQLTDREFEIFIKIASGVKACQIAEDLMISVSTVNTYRARILEKMKLKSNVGMTYYAMQHNLIE